MQTKVQWHNTSVVGATAERMRHDGNVLYLNCKGSDFMGGCMSKSTQSFTLMWFITCELNHSKVDILKHYENYVNKFENLDKMGKFLERHKLLTKLTQEDVKI